MKRKSRKIISFMIVTVFIVGNLHAIKRDIKNDNFKVPAYPNTLSINEKIFGLSKVWSEAKYNFVNIDKLNFDIDSLYYQSLDKVLKTENDDQYYDQIQVFLAALNDGHTELLHKPYSWNLYNDYIPALIKEINQRFYFVSVRKGIDSLDSTALGAEIIEIEDIPVRDYVIENYFPKISASTEQHRFMQAATKMMQGIKGSKLNGKARKLNGDIFSFSITRNGETIRTSNDQYYEPSKTRNDCVNLNWKDDIAILEVASFSGRRNEIQKINTAAEEINQKAKGLIIDIRNNGGGTTDVANHLLQYIIQSDTFLNFGAQRKINDSYGRSQGNYRDEYEDFYLGKAYKMNPPETIHVDSMIERFNCPIIILIGEYTFSAAEDFLVNLYEVPNRPLLIGQPTGGSTGAPLVFTIPNDTYVRICTLRICYPYSGKPFCQKGVVPDEIIYPNISDYIVGVDNVLESALIKMNSLIR